MVTAILAILVVGLLYRLLSIRLSLRQICRDLPQKFTIDTNTLLTVSTGDRLVRRLAAMLNRELRQLTAERRRLQSGDLALKEAITNISHDLRTPLTAISGYLDLLEREELNEASRQYTAVLRERTESMTALTEELFQYSVIVSASEELSKEPVDVGRVLAESLMSFYAALTQRGIKPEIALPEQPVVRRLDRAALKRVFQNLLSNALKYSDGDLAVHMSDAGEIWFSNRAEGLDKVAADKLFDRFYTVESARRSTGLGLSIAKHLTQKMGDSIGAGYSDGRLTIHLHFPA